MKRVLIIQPQFVPCSYPTSQRTRLFTNHLSDLGWEPTVFCSTPGGLEEAPDPGYEKLIHPDLNIQRFRPWSPKLTRKLGLGDLGIRSLLPLKARLRRELKKNCYDAALIHGPPWFCFLLGPWLRDYWGIPFLLDYIDPWISEFVAPTQNQTKAILYRHVAQRLEPQIIRKAAGIIAVSGEHLKALRKTYPQVDRLPTAEIPYGIEASDFEAIPSAAIPDAFPQITVPKTLVYAGARLPASIPLWNTLFAAMGQLRDDTPPLADRIRIRLLGTTYAHNHSRELIRPLAQSYGVSDLVEEIPARQPYLETLAGLKRADGILVVGSIEPHYTASKIFPTLAAQKPLIGLVHGASSVVPILKQAGVTSVLGFDQPEEIGNLKSEIATWIGQFAEDQLPPPDPFLANQALAPFTARKMTERLVGILDEVTSSQS